MKPSDKKDQVQVATSVPMISRTPLRSAPEPSCVVGVVKRDNLLRFSVCAQTLSEKLVYLRPSRQSSEDG